MFFWNSLGFSMIQRMLAIWSLVPLPFLKPAWTSGSSWFAYCWSLVRRILSIILLHDHISQSLTLMCLPSCFSRASLFVTLWTVAHQAPLSVGFSRQEYWSGLLWCPPVDLPDPGTEPASLMSSALAGGFFTTSATWGAQLTLKSAFYFRRQRHRSLYTGSVW